MATRILVADDDPAVRFLLSEVLAGDRYEVVFARNGQEAIDLAHRDCPDLAVLDGSMPILTGFQVCSQMKSTSLLSHTRVIMLTAFAQDADRARGEAAGADAYITKPFSPAVLLAKVEELLNRAPRSSNRNGAAPN